MSMNQHKVTFWGVITTLITFITSIIGGLIFVGTNWDKITNTLRKTDIIYQHADELEHIINDSHEILNNQSKHEREYTLLTAKADSLESVLKLINKGKHPYDSIWIQYPNGTWYRTTINELMNGDDSN